MDHQRLFTLFALLGSAVFAASGALAAGRQRFDLIGAAFLAGVTALGGGTLRDLLLDIHPVFWVRQPAILWSTVVAGALALVYVRFRRPPWKALLIADALGLAFFSIVGTQVAEDAGEGGIVAVTMGLLTGVAGGVLRDLLSGEVPLLFRPGETLYATASLAGVSCYLLAQPAGLARGPAALAGMALILALRLTAIALGLRLPALEVPEPEDLP
jgi:uncharacterized membrane protein YeiH